MRLPLFGQLLAALYQNDVVEEDHIRIWHKRSIAKGEGLKEGPLLEGVMKCWTIGKKMIEQFDEQESSEEESEDEDEDDGEDQKKTPAKTEKVVAKPEESKDIEDSGEDEDSDEDDEEDSEEENSEEEPGGQSALKPSVSMQDAALVAQSVKNVSSADAQAATSVTATLKGTAEPSTSDTVSDTKDIPDGTVLSEESGEESDEGSTEASGSGSDETESGSEEEAESGFTATKPESVPTGPVAKAREEDVPSGSITHNTASLSATSRPALADKADASAPVVATNASCAESEEDEEDEESEESGEEDSGSGESGSDEESEESEEAQAEAQTQRQTPASIERSKTS